MISPIDAAEHCSTLVIHSMEREFVLCADVAVQSAVPAASVLAIADEIHTAALSLAAANNLARDCAAAALAGLLRGHGLRAKRSSGRCLGQWTALICGWLTGSSVRPRQQSHWSL